MQVTVLHEVGAMERREKMAPEWLQAALKWLRKALLSQETEQFGRASAGGATVEFS
jgi:hypothetical protein